MALSKTPGSFEELHRQHRVLAAATSGQTREAQIQEARQTFGSVRILSNGKVLSGLLPDADDVTARAVIDHKRSVRIVDIPDPGHPHSHTLRILNLETPDGVQHAAILKIDNKSHEVEKVFVSCDRDGNPDRIGKGLANSQSDMLNPKNGGLHFTNYSIEPLDETHKGWIRDINSAIDKIYNMRKHHPELDADGKVETSRPEPIDPRDGMIGTTQAAHREPSADYAIANPGHYKSSITLPLDSSHQPGGKAPEIRPKDVRPH